MFQLLKIHWSGNVRYSGIADAQYQYQVLGHFVDMGSHIEYHGEMRDCQAQGLGEFHLGRGIGTNYTGDAVDGKRQGLGVLNGIAGEAYEGQ